MSKIIINNSSKVVSDDRALSLVISVIKKGKISNDGKDYCYLVLFSIEEFVEVAVSATKNKASNTFNVWDYPPRKDG